MSQRNRLILRASDSGAGRDASRDSCRPPLFVGEEVSYVSLDGISVCKATVRGVNLRGADLDVYSPGCSTPVALTGVAYHEGLARVCPRGQCFSPTAKGEPA